MITNHKLVLKELPIRNVIDSPAIIIHHFILKRIIIISPAIEIEYGFGCTLTEYYILFHVNPMNNPQVDFIRCFAFCFDNCDVWNRQYILLQVSTNEA